MPSAAVCLPLARTPPPPPAADWPAGSPPPFPPPKPATQVTLLADDDDGARVGCSATHPPGAVHMADIAAALSTTPLCSVLTDADGRYAFDGVPCGKYTLQVRCAVMLSRAVLCCAQCVVLGCRVREAFSTHCPLPSASAHPVFLFLSLWHAPAPNTHWPCRRRTRAATARLTSSRPPWPLPSGRGTPSRRATLRSRGLACRGAS